MDQYYKRKEPEPSNVRNEGNQCINWEEEIKFDPGGRKLIDAYHPNLRERVRRMYLEHGPSQPRTCHFPFSHIAGTLRRFNSEWFNEFGSWLEYSEFKDKAYYFCCFLFREKISMWRI
jgi:hypothetical protein